MKMRLRGNHNNFVLILSFLLLLLAVVVFASPSSYSGNQYLLKGQFMGGKLPNICDAVVIVL
jgi:hypothetical protein